MSKLALKGRLGPQKERLGRGAPPALLVAKESYRLPSKQVCPRGSHSGWGLDVDKMALVTTPLSSFLK